jgi:hypothetical protein
MVYTPLPFYPYVTNGGFWILARDAVDGLEKLYRFGYDFVQLSSAITPINMESSSSSEGYIEEMHVSAIDVDRQSSPNYFVYVIGGNSHKSWIQKYDASGNYVDSNMYHDITFCYDVKVVQAYGSSSLYLLEDTTKWDEFGYGSSSSSSSSSSTEIRSSSSSSLSFSSSSSSSP